MKLLLFFLLAILFQFGYCRPRSNTLFGLDGHGVFYKNYTETPNNIQHVFIPGVKYIALSFDPVEDYLYWTDVGTRWIAKTKFGYDLSRKLTTDVVWQLPKTAVADGLAVDYINRLIYFTDAGLDQLSVLTLNGTKFRTLIRGLDKPRGIALNPVGGKMYWTDWGAKKIESADMDGTNRKAIITSNINWVNGITIDLKIERLFWCDTSSTGSKIESAKLDGTDRKVLLSTSGHMFDLVLDDHFIYFTGWTSKISENHVNTLDRKTGRLSSIGHNMTTRLHGLEIWNKNRLITGKSQCVDNNGGCDVVNEICVPVPNGRSCMRANFINFLPTTARTMKPQLDKISTKTPKAATATILKTVLATTSLATRAPSPQPKITSKSTPGKPASIFNPTTQNSDTNTVNLLKLQDKLQQSVTPLYYTMGALALVIIALVFVIVIVCIKRGRSGPKSPSFTPLSELPTSGNTFGSESIYENPQKLDYETVGDRYDALAAISNDFRSWN